MKKICLIILLFTTIKSIAVNNSNFLKITAKLSEKYVIEMNLKITENSVNGYYYYTKYKTNIPLVGKINNEKSEILLIEKPWTENSLSNPTKGFILNISNDQITGKWFDKSPEKELLVNGYFKTEKLKPETETEGNYKSLRNSEKFQGFIELINIHDNIFVFDILTYTESGCIGELYEIIRIETHKGIFKNQSCEISVELDKNSIIISEQKCAAHGYRCYFDGKYLKQ